MRRKQKGGQGLDGRRLAQVYPFSMRICAKPPGHGDNVRRSWLSTNWFAQGRMSVERPEGDRCDRISKQLA
jgi:hypothetical protein